MAEKKTWKSYRHQKEFVVRTRIDAETIGKLDVCCRLLETSRSEILRMGIGRIYEELMKDH